MALSVGDAVLTFLADTTQLDTAFNKIATEAGEKLGIAATGSIEGMSKAMAVGQQGAVELGNITDLAGEKVRESMYEARGEIGLLGEAFGINLPRHVRSFVAELPGVGSALSAAFQATAVLFLIEALIQGIEKIVEFAEHGEKAAQAWAKATLDLENLTIKQGDHTKSLELSNLKLDDQIAKLENRPQANRLREALIETSIAADQLAAAFSKDFEKMTEQINAATSLTAQFSQGMASVFRSGLTGDAVGALGAGLAAGITGIQAVKDSLSQVEEKLLEINKLRIEQANAKTEEQQIAANHALAEGYGVLAQTSNNALGIVRLNAPDNIKLITELSATVINATAAQKDFGLQSENVYKRLRVAADESAKEQAAALQKKDKEVIQSINERLAEEQKLYKKETDASLKSTEEELAAQKKANSEALQLAHQKMEGQIAIIDREIVLREQAAQRDAEILKGQYDRRELTGQQYLGKLRALYQQEQADLIAMLNRKEQFVILEAQNEAAQKGRILTTEEAKELKSVIDLETKKAQIRNEYDNKFLKTEEQVTTKIAKEYATLTKLLDDYVKHLRAAEKDLQGFGKVANSILGDVSNAFGSAIESWLSGQDSFGKAMEKALAQYLIQVAGKAAIDALYFAAWGIADSFWNPPRAGADFAAAAEFAAIAAVAGAAGAALGSTSKGGGSGGGGQGPQVDQNNPNNQPGQNPQQGGRNVPHLSDGGLITSPTLAMIHSNEAVIPLGDSGVMSAIADALDRHTSSGRGDIHVHVQGLISADHLGKVMKRMSRQVQTGRGIILSSNALKTTRRG